MTTRLFVRDLCVFAHHGVLPEETRLGQRFFLDMDAEVDIPAAVREDDYTRAVCYGALCDLAVEVSRGRNFQLIETLADRIAERALAAHPDLVEIAVRVRKPSAALAHALDHVGVEVSRRRMMPVGFSLGSNQGAREVTLQAALALLGTVEGLEIERVSPLYDSAPWGGVEQEGFVNLCAVGVTSLSPLALLRVCKETELALGRVPGVRWGPRVVDVDLLYVGNREVSGPVLTLPHAEMQNRAFVLAPLSDIAPDHQIGGVSVAGMLERLVRQPGDAERRAAEE